MKIYIILLMLLIAPCISNAEIINVQIKGIDDGIKTTKQQDYIEAVLFAKREAIERAGVKIKSITTIKDLVVNSDYIESQAEAILMPGYNVLDMGYSADGTYQVVLVGKVKTMTEESIDSKELRYAKSLMDRGEKKRVKEMTVDIIKNSKDDEVIAEAIYCQLLWNFIPNARATFEKLEAYYPSSKYTERFKNVLIERESKKRIIKDRDGTFVIYNNYVIYDESTGLEWFVMRRNDVSWGQAKSWVDKLTVFGGGWKMPSLEELRTLYQPDEWKRNRTYLLASSGWKVWARQINSSMAEVFCFRRGGTNSSLCQKYKGYESSYKGCRCFAVRSQALSKKKKGLIE